MTSEVFDLVRNQTFSPKTLSRTCFQAVLSSKTSLKRVYCACVTWVRAEEVQQQPNTEIELFDHKYRPITLPGFSLNGRYQLI